MNDLVKDGDIMKRMREIREELSLKLIKMSPEELKAHFAEFRNKPNRVIPSGKRKRKELIPTFATMYAVVFDLDTNCLNEQYDEPTYHNAYKKVKEFMLSNGFSWTQGSVYFGDANIDAVTCVLTVQKLAKTYPWFSTCVKDIRMLRIEENNDLMPAINF